ncbi:MAG: 5'-methylthioadenosine/adenosylhomocysteine nucleosidase [Bacteroidaceae bacterium]
MTIGIINAMQKEHAQIVALLQNSQVTKDGHLAFTTGSYNGKRLVLMQSGIGKVNAAVGAVELIRRYAPDMLVNTGVAGGIDDSLHVMDVVVGAQVAYHDVDCGPENEPGQVQGLPAVFVANKRLLSIASSLQTTTRIISGLICSGDQFITNHQQLNNIKKCFPEGLAVDMESGALAQVCHLYSVPFLSFRIISDTPGTEGHFDQYVNFWDTMAERSFGVTRTLLDAITSQL